MTVSLSPCYRSFNCLCN